MPLYEYECNACGHRFERIQKFSDPLVETCPSCGGQVRRLVSSPAIQFKGTGWYITDYAKKSGEKSGGESKPSKAGDSASETKTTETKSTSTEQTKPAANSPSKDTKKDTKS